MNIIQKLKELSPARLTVREQARVQDNLPELIWDRFFPTRDVDTIDLSEITETDFRPVADRREWDAPGRNIPLKMGKIRKAEMTPIEDYFKIGEREMTKYFERNGQNEQLVLEAIKGDIPGRVETLVDAIYRRIEVEAFSAWANGTVQVVHPQTGNTLTVSMMVDSSRYVTPTAWTGGDTGTAYDEFLKHTYEAQNMIGNLSGARMRRTTALAIQESAPRLTASSVRMTLTEVSDRISQELGTEFTIQVDERTVDKFTGAGSETTATKLHPSNKVMYVPAGESVGSTYMAPQARAQALAQVAGDLVSQRGVNIYYVPENNGKALSVEAQLNALPFPNEQKIYVVDTGI